MFKHWEYMHSNLNQRVCSKLFAKEFLSTNLKQILPRLYWSLKKLPLRNYCFTWLINRKLLYTPFYKQWYAKKEADLNEQDLLWKWKTDFSGRHLCHWRIREARERKLNPLKHRRQKLPIAPPSSSRFPPFPRKLKTKLGTPELQNSSNNVLSSPVLHFRCTHVAAEKKLILPEFATTSAAFSKFSP